MWISPAFAEEATDTAAAAAGDPGILMSMLPLLLIFMVFYFMVIRPQNARIQEHRKTINALQKGDKVVTGGGIIGTVKKLIGDDEIVVEIADGVDVHAVRSTIITKK